MRGRQIGWSPQAYQPLRLRHKQDTGAPGPGGATHCWHVDAGVMTLEKEASSLPQHEKAHKLSSGDPCPPLQEVLGLSLARGST